MRLLTRSDFDGVVCAALLEELDIVDDYKFIHPKVIQDKRLVVTENDVLANIPYAPGCGLWFDHHTSEFERLDMDNMKFKGDCRPAPSTAQVIWDYYGGEETLGKRFLPQLKAVNRFDAGILSREDIISPKGWILIAFLLDPRTGLGRVRDFKVKNHILIPRIIRFCRTKTANEILGLPGIVERVERYFKEQNLYKEMVSRCCKINGNMIILNLLDEQPIFIGNRFITYVLHPEQNIEVRLMWGASKKYVVITCGHSVLNRTSKTDVGSLMLKYGGGGQMRVGSCQVPAEKWEKILREILERIKEDG